jgi:hypothetical protein
MAGQKRVLKILIGTLLAVLLPATLNSLLAQEPPGREATIAVITSPVPDSTISGQVVIMGSAGHPALFAYYELEYKNLLEPNDIWLPVGARISQQKTNEILGIWDTVGTGVADGTYLIRLRVFLNSPDEPPVEFIVNNLQLINTTPTPLPNIPPTSQVTLLPATPGPSPTSLIDQPPTTTPRPTIETLGNTSDNSQSPGFNSSQGETTLNFGRIRSAFCTGSILALIFFGLLGSYVWLRARFRPVARQVMWQIRNEFEDDARR